MKSNRFSLFSFILVVFLVSLSNASYGINVRTDEGYNYRILETQSDAINMENTTAHISVGGTEQQADQRVVTLSRVKYIPPDVIKFVGGEGRDYDFVVLNQEDLSYYAFDGSSYSKINSLSLELDNPYGVAVSDFGGAPSYFISNRDVDGNGEIYHYLFDSSGAMIKSPLLNMGGVQSITGITTFKDTNDFAYSTEEEVNFYANAGASYEQVFGMNYESPIAIAAGQSGYSFAVLGKDKIERYMFDGTNFTNVPALEIAIDQETMGEVRNVVVDDNTNSTYLLTNEQLRGYSFDGYGMTYNSYISLSDADGLESPQAIAFNHNQNGLMLVDYVKEETYEGYKGKYFMLDESGRYINVPQLSMEMNDIVTKITPEYREEGILEFMSFIPEKEVDLARIRAYTETPKGTKITFQVSNSLDVNGDPLWQDSWVVDNPASDSVTAGNITKYSYDDKAGGFASMGFGTNSNGYPTFDKTESETGTEGSFDPDGLDDYIIDEDGNLIVSHPANYENSLWTKLPQKGGEFRVRAVLSTTDTTVTPRIFVPIGSANNSEYLPADTTAMHMEFNDAPEKPIIDDVGGGEGENPGQTPGDGEMSFESVEGWIYTTTPTLKWRFATEETEGEEVGQSAYQVLLLARGEYGWKTVYNSGFKSSPNYNYTVPFEDRLFYNSNAYEYGMAVRVMDELGGISEFSDTKKFKVLAYEWPRIVNLVNPTDTEGGIEPPSITDVTTHRLIRPEHTVSDLLRAKAGSQITLAIDSVGPIASPAMDNAKFYIEIDGEEIGLNLIDSKPMNSVSSITRKNSWMFNFYTDAPITTIPDGSLVKARFAGKGHSSDYGGVTIFYMPSYSDGVIVTGDTIYSDWQVVIQGRDR